MHITTQKEQFSRAYVQALAARMGYSTATPRVDDDSVDMILLAKNISGAKYTRAQMDIQLKCTEHCHFVEGQCSFSLSQKNYDDLRAHVCNPRLLVVVHVPSDICQWLEERPEELALRKCAYWLSLKDSAATGNAKTSTVQLQQTQVFSLDFLETAMKKIANGEDL